MKKKLLALILVLSIVTAMLSSCSSKEKSEVMESTANPQIAQEAAEGAKKEHDAAGEINNEKSAESSAEYTTAMEDKSDENYGMGTGESYIDINENNSVSVAEESVVTFSLKVDTSSYTNVQRYIDTGNTPPVNAVKIEELINYFSYDEYMEFTDDSPFSIYTEIGPSPFDENKNILMARIKSKEIDKKDFKKSNLVFLIDTSGSMFSDDKLPLLIESFKLLVENLSENDRVSIVTYAGDSRIALDSASGYDKNKIFKALDGLDAGGSTAGAEGILTAYKLAEKNFIKDGNNRIILASDGDFNVGVSSIDKLSELISEKRESNIYLSVLGFGTGNIRDDIMETLAKDGNGNYSYINSVSTAKKVLVEELSANLYVIADDVKAQIEFNPAHVKNYRQIGYENRQLRNEDFDDDTKDAGEIGIGTDVIFLFEIEIYSDTSPNTTGKKYQKQTSDLNEEFADEFSEIRIRYKNPGEAESKLILTPTMITDLSKSNTRDYNFAVSVAAYGHLLRESEHTGNANINDVIKLAKNNVGDDVNGYRSAHMELLNRYKKIIN